MPIELYSHQKEAVEKLRSGSILCGGVGTGKSRTALAYFYCKVGKGKLPKAHSRNFEYMRNDVKLYIITTARKRDGKEWDDEISPFPIEDYVVDSWNNIGKYSDVENAFFIFDEQRVVGKGAWVKNFLKIAKENRWILLTATPGDTWLDYIPVFIANGFYKNRTEFIRRHVVYSSYVKFPKVQRYLETGRLERLRSQITITMEYDKEAVQNHEWIKIGYDKDVYDAVKKKRWNVYENRPIRNHSELCYICRKVLNSDARRIEGLKNILSRHVKAIVFYNFDYELDMIETWLNENEFVYAQWNGHRHEFIPKTNNWVYLVQYSAGAEGWNCVETDTMIFFSLNYSYKILHQACGRIDRLNTEFKNLYYYHFFSDGEIDRAIRSCIKKKKDFNENLLHA